MCTRKLRHLLQMFKKLKSLSFFLITECVCVLSELMSAGRQSSQTINNTREVADKQIGKQDCDPRAKLCTTASPQVLLSVCCFKRFNEAVTS